MTLSLQFNVVVVACVILAVQADVSHLGYNRYNGNRNAPLRLQRVESRPTPYPSAGYRPNREFNLPHEQPLFPLANTQQSSSGFDNLSEPQQKPQLVYGAPGVDNQRLPQQQQQQQQQQNSHGFNNFAEQGNTQPSNSNGFDNLSEPQQKPQLVYGAPGVDNQRFPQQQPAPRPQNSNGFNNFAETQPQDFNVAQQNQEFENTQGFNNLAEPQQRPELLYAAPNNPQTEQNNGFDNLAEPQQRPQYNYNSPARLRQLLIASLQQARAQLQNQPQTLYSAPAFQQQQPSPQIDTQNQAQAESQPSPLIAAKPARLTDNREDREEETAESALDIETTTKKDSTEPKATNGTAVAASPVAAPANGVVAYYPATAFTYVQPYSAAYVAAAANYHTIQPVNAAYTVGSHFLPQQYAFAAAPAQLQAW